MQMVGCRPEEGRGYQREEQENGREADGVNGPILCDECSRRSIRDPVR
jgi:hypothetical protein